MKYLVVYENLWRPCNVNPLLVKPYSFYFQDTEEKQDFGRYTRTNCCKTLTETKTYIDATIVKRN